MHNSPFDVIVVGGGAAGLLAAGSAAEAGARVLLLEKMPRLGSKLRLTGGGRCNLSNSADLQTFLAAFGPQGAFLNNAFGRFFRDDLLALLDRLGVPTLTEPDGRIFPASGQAGDIIAALARYLRAGNVAVQLNQPVAGLLVEDAAIRGVRVPAGAQPARSVILAAGGASYPGTGSTGDGYAWLAAAGHTIHPLRPALVALETVEEWPHPLAGLALAAVGVALLVDGQRCAARVGELLFTHFGLSGPALLNLSGLAAQALGRGRVQVSIDLLPADSDEAADARLRDALAESGRRTLGAILRGWLPARLVIPLLELAGIPAARVASQASAAERRRILAQMRDLRLTIRRARPLREAMLTAGGVELKEIDPRTLESRRIAGLYVVGELLDLVGETGGFNLQAAFSTGYVAGQAAAASHR